MELASLRARLAPPAVAQRLEERHRRALGLLELDGEEGEPQVPFPQAVRVVLLRLAVLGASLRDFPCALDPEGVAGVAIEVQEGVGPAGAAAAEGAEGVRGVVALDAGAQGELEILRPAE